MHVGFCRLLRMKVITLSAVNGRITLLLYTRLFSPNRICHLLYLLHVSLVNSKFTRDYRFIGGSS